MIFLAAEDSNENPLQAHAESYSPVQEARERLFEWKYPLTRLVVILGNCYHYYINI